MRKRLTKHKINQRLASRKIKLIGNYEESRRKAIFQCSACAYVWKTKSGSVLYGGSGCPKCAGKVKLTKEKVNQRLASRKITLMEDYIGAHRKTTFKCGQCEHTWLTSPSNVLYNGSGCPKCAGLAKRRENQNMRNLGVHQKVDSSEVIPQLKAYVTQMGEIPFRQALEDISCSTGLSLKVISDRLDYQSTADDWEVICKHCPDAK